MALRHGSAWRAGVCALLAAFVTCVAACGGDTDPAEPVGFTASATVECVKSRDLVRDVNTVTEVDALTPESLLSGDPTDLTGLLSDASGGEFTITFDSGTSVVLSFHGEVTDAEAHLLTLQLISRELGIALAQRKANATMAWRKKPTRHEVDLVTRCLEKGGGPIPIHEQDPSFAKSYRYTDEQRAAMASALRDRGFEQSTVACFMEWAQERYPIADLLQFLPADKDPVRAALEQCERR